MRSQGEVVSHEWEVLVESLDLQVDIKGAGGVDADFLEVRIHVTAVDVRLHCPAAIQPLDQNYVPRVVLSLVQLLRERSRKCL